MYAYHGTEYLGAAHGLAGILFAAFMCVIVLLKFSWGIYDFFAHKTKKSADWH